MEIWKDINGYEGLYQVSSNGKIKSSKPIIQYDLNGKYIKEYPSMHEAARQLGVKQGGISMCCRGIAKTAYGFIWLFK